ncbi:cytochrome c oxidase subunit II [Cryobacterium sp. TMT1-21]|uniref:aa3-type cytochrome oxidase subunit II n=1 Tax=unclassified Cryobacterium TaxID=2649013 RepID=UPI00106B1AE3|nr:MULTISPECIES: cytochrome c oxidase subunit II [unclassified Cryobacterium]TFC82393.1 cytochrome c oxidase subunit II [Cryobacterium sp. TmT2-59]TFD16395.1 cytochrome c oxidase subunit II [Cryobacterium sp. TMT1-21]TFD17708.1 cytochrome c oxidase subunit II [Cryobacterium sp. TMT4-10]TFD27985.1 cytochrome c oxidase subunit II [Cryobacterium sp. TMT2-23]TFD43989.1 cytochrome c oxidase subunit II [Cryobacterium sp. TMT2-10]
MRKNHRLRWAAIPIAASLAVVLAGCTQAQLHGFLPGFEEGQPAVTNQTERISGLWTTSWIVLMIVGLITWGLTIWAVVVYRRRKGQTGLPVQLRYNMPIEIFYTVVPLILVVGFFAFTARDQAAIEARFDAPDIKVEVIGKQWAWDFNYVNEDVFTTGVQGQPDLEGAKGALVESEIPTLVLPVGQKIELALESRDVIHSFWVVDFLYKKDMIPGKTNYMSVIPERIGTYSGKCAELCGEYHSLMLFKVEVVSQADYATYIDSLRAAGNEGQVDNDYKRNSNLPGTSAPTAQEGN